MEKNNFSENFFLETLTLQQLKTFGKNIGLTGYSKLRKAPLLCAISQFLFRKDTVFSFLWQQPLKTIELLKGMLGAEKTKVCADDTESLEKPFSYGYVRPAKTGDSTEDYASLENTELCLNENFRPLFEQWLQEEGELFFAQREIMDYCMAAANLWGKAPLGELSKLYEKHNHVPLSVETIQETLAQFPDSKQNSFKHLGDFVVANDLWENETLFASLDNQQGKPYYMPSKEVFLNYCDPYYFENTAYTQAYSNFLIQQLNVSPWTAKEILEQTVAFVEAEHPLRDIIDLLTARKVVFENDAQLGALMSALTNLINHTRLWYNNGHTAEELAGKKSPVHSPQKTGRNMPCPCGSGKKYKHCCGK